MTEGFAQATDGTRLWWNTLGEGPVVMLCDGIACDGFVWKYLRPALAAHYCTLHWNYRGHGRSGAPRDPTRVTISDHARDLHSVLDHLSISHAALLGHSMGTQVCLEAWQQHPARVSGLGLLCGSFGRITRTFHGSDVLHHALPYLAELVEKHPTIARNLLSRSPVSVAVTLSRWLGEVDSLRVRPEDLAPYFEHMRLLDPAMFFRMLAAAGTHSAEDYLPDIDCPTLVIAAERDSFTPTRWAEQMARQIPDAELLRVSGGSHAAPIEQPTLINTRVLKFLSERVYPPPPSPPSLPSPTV